MTNICSSRHTVLYTMNKKLFHRTFDTVSEKSLLTQAENDVRKVSVFHSAYGHQFFAYLAFATLTANGVLSCAIAIIYFGLEREEALVLFSCFVHIVIPWLL